MGCMALKGRISTITDATALFVECHFVRPLVVPIRAVGWGFCWSEYVPCGNSTYSPCPNGALGQQIGSKAFSYQSEVELFLLNSLHIPDNTYNKAWRSRRSPCRAPIAAFLSKQVVREPWKFSSTSPASHVS
jgi:hypothetical protein